MNRDARETRHPRWIPVDVLGPVPIDTPYLASEGIDGEVYLVYASESGWYSLDAGFAVDESPEWILVSASGEPVVVPEPNQ